VHVVSALLLSHSEDCELFESFLTRQTAVVVDASHRTDMMLLVLFDTQLQGPGIGMPGTRMEGILYICCFVLTVL
jgi:hypothetical protein